MLKPAAVMVIALVLVSCSAAVPTDRGSVPSSAAAESISPREGSAMSEFAISMWRGACFGRCPQYKLTVDGGGGVEFVGERAVNALGAHSGKADMAAVATLRSKASEVFSTLTDVVPGAASGKHYATDPPPIPLALRTVRHVRTPPHHKDLP